MSNQDLNDPVPCK